MSTVIVSNFNRLTPANFLAQAERIVTAMTGNAGFPEPWPSTVPTLAQIQADLAAYQATVTATAAGDRTQVARRNAARSTLAQDLTLLAYQVQLTAKGDASLLTSTGFPLKQRAPRTIVTDLPPAPARFRLSHGAVSGMIVVNANRVPGAGSYEVQMATADPTVEANWTSAGTYKNSRRIAVPGLAAGKVYSFRMRALNAAGFGTWTSPESLMSM